jgi:hypothetical protein
MSVRFPHPCPFFSVALARVEKRIAMHLTSLTSIANALVVDPAIANTCRVHKA